MYVSEIDYEKFVTSERLQQIKQSPSGWVPPIGNNNSKRNLWRGGGGGGGVGTEKGKGMVAQDEDQDKGFLEFWLL